MAGRHALITADDEALAAVLADPARGGFTVERGRGRDDVAAFLAARVPTDVVLIHADDVDQAALQGCRSTHVLVLTTGRTRLRPTPGRAVLSGAAPEHVARALRDGRADRDADGDVTAEELYERLKPTLMVELDSRLDTPFVITRTQRPAEKARRARRRWFFPGLVGAGGVGLLVSLPLPWVFGESGLEYAFGAGTVWTSRVAVLVVMALMLAAAAYMWRPRWETALLALVTGAYGAVLGLLLRWDEPEVGVGAVFALGGTTLILAGILKEVLRHRFASWLTSVGGFLAALNVVYDTSWWVAGIGLCMVALGVWLDARR